MGKLIVIWSPQHGVAKTTASMVALASQIALVEPEARIAVTHTQSAMSDLEGIFLSRQSSKATRDFYASTGLTALKKILFTREITPSDVSDCEIANAFTDNLVLLPGMDSGKAMQNDADVQNIIESILIKNIVPAYHYTLVDAAAGNNRLSQHLIRQADAVVVVLPQNGSQWDKFRAEYPALEEASNIYYLIGGYMDDSKYSAKMLISKFDNASKNNVGIVPFDTGYMDAISVGNVCSYLYSHTFFDKEDKKIFQARIKETASHLLNFCNAESAGKR